VLLAALDGTFQRKPFPNILELVARAENVIKLRLKRKNNDLPNRY
jgi:thymidine kinase